jgi:membrane protein required for colicin V production
MNTFDAVVYACLAVAVVLGFSSGLLRSLATILGYLAAAPVAFFAAPTLAPLVGVFLAAGIVFGALLRLVVSGLVGKRVSLPDRLAGALLGAVRIGLIAVLIVLVFDRVKRARGF